MGVCGLTLMIEEYDDSLNSQRTLVIVNCAAMNDLYSTCDILIVSDFRERYVIFYSENAVGWN